MIATNYKAWWKRNWKSIALLIAAGVCLAVMLLPTRQAIWKGRRPPQVNKLRDLALAFHYYADAHNNALPPFAAFSKDGRPLLSWRVLILPFLEQEDLYRQFRLDEAWDSV